MITRVEVAADSPASTSEAQGRFAGRLRNTIVVVVTIALMALLVRQIASSPVSRGALANANVGGLVLAVALMCICVTLGVFKWRMVLRGLGFELGFGLAARALLTAWPFGAVTPSRAGELVRSFVIRERVPLLQGNVSVLVDRLLDVQTLVLLAFVGSLDAGWHWVSVGLGGGLVFAWMCAILLVRKGTQLSSRLPETGWADLLIRLGQAFSTLLDRGRGSLVRASLTSLAMWLVAQTMFMVLARSFGAPLSLMDCFTLWPMGVLIGLVPLTIAGIGTRDLAYVWILGQVHGEAFIADHETILLVTVAYTAITSWLFALVGTPMALRWLVTHRGQRTAEPSQD